ncbi:hypothetical protein OGAPHI_001961 [Ogataea philodendri]|uniref:CID domain-containing protein n=1 Tax=Ogataea philodendri TaxID=1378263 RepID=A0A9P8PA34_9ASCO|nr:uncharacterized protein OGAPHI_001961 [Ogataea philodendri]KAH3668207.1 hypothetical protein OGAPHI_001961 [Ogataea philodendri]
MDSFEARVYLTKQLSSLTPSKLAAQQCAKFLLKNKELQDDLYSVILETLDAADLNIRLNIFQFLEELIFFCQNDPQRPYVNSIFKDMKLILTKILPPKPENQSSEARLLTNLSSAYIILFNISKTCNYPHINDIKTRFNSNLLTELDKNRIELQLHFDEKPLYTDITAKQDVESQLTAAWDFLIEKRRQSQYERLFIDKHNIQSPAEPLADLFTKTRKQLLARIEADRERQKRGKENLWQIDRAKGSLAEFDLIYDTFHQFDLIEDKPLIDEVNELYENSRHGVTRKPQPNKRFKR